MCTRGQVWCGLGPGRRARQPLTGRARAQARTTSGASARSGRAPGEGLLQEPRPLECAASPGLVLLGWPRQAGELLVFSSHPTLTFKVRVLDAGGPFEAGRLRPREGRPASQWQCFLPSVAPHSGAGQQSCFQLPTRSRCVSIMPAPKCVSLRGCQGEPATIRFRTEGTRPIRGWTCLAKGPWLSTGRGLKSAGRDPRLLAGPALHCAPHCEQDTQGASPFSCGGCLCPAQAAGDPALQAWY